MSKQARAPVRVKGMAPTAGVPVVEVDWGLAYELLLGLRMFVDAEEDPATYTAGPGWFDEVRAAAPPELLDAIHRFSGGHEMCFGFLLGLVTETDRPRDVPAFLRYVTALDPMDLRLRLLGYDLETYREGVPRETIADAARGDREAIRRFLGAGRQEHCGCYEHVLSMDAGSAKDLLVEVATGWDKAVLSPSAAKVAGILRRQASEARALLGRMPIERLVDTVTRGLQYAGEPGIDRILLVPSYVGRPWVILSEHRGTKIVCFAARESETDGAEAPPEDLVRIHKALGDETRLRLLRRLRERSATLQELVDHVGLAKSTVHGHLLALRTSGLVLSSLVDKRYSLRPEALDEARDMLGAYLGDGEPA